MTHRGVRDWPAMLVAIHRDGVTAADIAEQQGTTRQAVSGGLAYHAMRYQRQHPDLLDRLQHYSTPDPETGCWRWHGGTSNGYPSLRLGSHAQPARRLAWQWQHGELPPRIRVHAICGQQQCVTPEHMSLRPQGTPRTDDDRFWARVDRSAGDDGCWLWIGPTVGAGLPSWVEIDRRVIPPAQRALELSLGQPLRPSLALIRLCDTPTCVNPIHHHASSRAGYQPHTQRGEARPNARLTWEIVADIRARHQAGESQASLAREYRVSTGSLSMIVNRTIWIPYPEAVLREIVPCTVVDGCLLHDSAQAHAYSRGRLRSIRHIAWELSHGERLPRHTKVYATCGRADCVLPDHLTLTYTQSGL